MRVIGLTGGMGTGKSAVASLLSAQSIPVWDADLAARQVVAPGTALLQTIAERYGADLINPQGSLDRTRLGQIVFANSTELDWLEGQIHPQVRSLALAWLKQQTVSTVALVVPLLFEAQMTELVMEVWVVTCTPVQQRQRIQNRDGLSLAALEQRLARQWPLATKIARADVVLDNQGTLAFLSEQVQRALAPAPM